MSSSRRRRTSATSVSARESRAAKKRALLDAAAAVLARMGPEGFNVRDVAKAVGASTMVVYTLFGSREGLVEALCRDGLDRLADSLARVPAGTSLEAIGSLALVYRRFAIKNRAYYYAISTGPQARSIVRGSRAYLLLAAAVRRSIDAGVLAKADPHAVTDALWGLVHGMVSLELEGYFASARVAQERLVFAGVAMLRGLRAELI